jgi:hypothetical protein
MGRRSASPKFVRFLSSERYEHIRSLSAVARHFGDLGRSGSDTARYTRSTLPRVLPCLNPRCCEGGYDIVPVLHDLIERGVSSASTVLPCNGHDGLPLGRGSSKTPCMNSIELDIEIDYLERSDRLQGIAARQGSDRVDGIEA